MSDLLCSLWLCGGVHDLSASHCQSTVSLRELTAKDDNRRNERGLHNKDKKKKSLLIFPTAPSLFKLSKYLRAVGFVLSPYSFFFFQMMKPSSTTAQWWEKGAARGTAPQNVRASSLPLARSSNRGSGGRRKAVRSSKKLQKVGDFKKKRVIVRLSLTGRIRYIQLLSKFLVACVPALMFSVHVLSKNTTSFSLRSSKPEY